MVMNITAIVVSIFFIIAIIVLVFAMKSEASSRTKLDTPDEGFCDDCPPDVLRCAPCDSGQNQCPSTNGHDCCDDFCDVQDEACQDEICGVCPPCPDTTIDLTALTNDDVLKYFNSSDPDKKK